MWQVGYEDGAGVGTDAFDVVVLAAHAHAPEDVHVCEVKGSEEGGIAFNCCCCRVAGKCAMATHRRALAARR